MNLGIAILATLICSATLTYILSRICELEDKVREYEKDDWR